jgi:hypothetical protein
MAYESLVKPLMTYGLPAWHPTTQENINKLERVQRRALHFIYGRQLPPVADQKVLPMAMHLVYTDLVFFKRCISGATDFDAMARISEGRVLRGDSVNHPRLQQPNSRGGLGEGTFSFRVVAPWNNLPDALKDCEVKKFPAYCKSYLWQSV